MTFIPVFLSFIVGAIGFPVRNMGNSTPQLNRNLSQGSQLASHITPTTGVPSMSLHTPPSPSRCVPFFCVGFLRLELKTAAVPREEKKCSSSDCFLQGDVIDEFEEHPKPLSGRSGDRVNGQDQQHGQLRARESEPQLTQHHLYAQTAASAPTLHHQQVGAASAIWWDSSLLRSAMRCKTAVFICSMSGFGMNRNQAFGMNNSLSSNIFNGTGWWIWPKVTNLKTKSYPMHLYTKYWVFLAIKMNCDT